MAESFLRKPDAHETPSNEFQGAAPISDVDRLIEQLSIINEDDFLVKRRQFEATCAQGSVVAVIDQIDLLQSAAVQAIGFGRFPNVARLRAEQLLRVAQEARKEPLVSIIVDVCIDRLRVEDIAPSVGVIRFEGGKTHNDRVPARQLTSDQELLNSINVQPEIPPRSAVQRIAVDVVGVFDRSGVLTSVGRLPRDADGRVVLSEAFPVSARTVEFAQEMVADVQRNRSSTVHHGLSAVERCDAGVVEILHERIPEESIGLAISWNDVFAAIHVIAIIEQKIRLFESQLLEEAAQQNQADADSGFSNNEHADVARARTVKNRERVFLYTKELYAETEGTIERYTTAMQAIQSHAAEVKKILQSVIDHVAADRLAQTTAVVVVDVPHAVTDPQWSPFLADNQTKAAEQSQLLRYLYRADIRQAIEQRFDIQLSDVSFRSQMQLLEFLINGDAGTVAQFETALQQDGLARQQFLESFFALAKDSAMGGEILQFVIDSNDITVVNATLGVYADITGAVDTIVQSIVAVAARASASVDVRSVTQQLLTRANSVLRRQMELKEKGSERLAAVQADTVVFAAICQAAVKDAASGVTVEDMVGVTIRRVAGSDASPELRQQMVQVATENYRAEPHVATALAAVLHDAEALSRNQFHVLERFDSSTHQERLLAFVRAEFLSDDSVYLRSLNVDANARGAGIAAHFFDRVLDQYRGSRVIHAAMVPEIIAGTHYIEDNGFVVIGFDSDTAATETNFGLYTMTIDKDPAPSQLRGLSIEELRAQVLENPLDHIGVPTIVAQLRFPDEMDAVREISTALLEGGEYRMTRYIALDATGSVRLLGFEKNKPSV